MQRESFPLCFVSKYKPGRVRPQRETAEREGAGGEENARGGGSGNPVRFRPLIKISLFKMQLPRWFERAQGVLKNKFEALKMLSKRTVLKSPFMDALGIQKPLPRGSKTHQGLPKYNF